MKMRSFDARRGAERRDGWSRGTVVAAIAMTALAMTAGCSRKADNDAQAAAPSSGNVTLTADPRRVGKTGDHLALYVRSNGSTMKAIAFGAGEWCDRLKAGSVVHLACQPQVNEFNGYRSVELEVKDLQLAK